MRGAVVAVGLSMAALAGCLFSGDPAPRDPVRIELEPLIQGLDDPVFVTHAGDGSGRLFIVEQGGLIRVWDNGLKTKPFLDVEAKVSCCGERGLLGLAFHPDYSLNGRFFIFYTATGGDLTLAEYRNAIPSANEAEPGTESIILTVEHSAHSNHNGGMIAFGPDGMLYIATGDGGAGRDPNNNAQDIESLLGKILRVVPSPKVCITTPCNQVDIPSGNPFVGKAGRDEIWHYGLRNPWRFSFDRSTGDLWIGDVGQGAVEEVDLAPAGAGGLNFGWSRFEGSRIQDEDRQAPGAMEPVAEYANEGAHCAVTGGYMYRGSTFPDLQGTYLFGDYCSGTIWSLRHDGTDWVRRQALETSLSISSFGEDAGGELFVVDHAGDVYRIVAG